jgi:CRISPR-associated endonuclease/helicase Cas3
MEETDQTAPIAHVAPIGADQWRTHALTAHLTKVARLASRFGEPIGASDWLHAAGLWHDLGKASAAFQHYIREASGFERANAHVEGRPGRVNHSSAGALHAVATLGDTGKILAQLIMAHHAGLYDGEEITQRLARDRDCLAAALSASPPAEVLAVPTLDPPRVPGGVGASGAYALWLRLLFSCLVDADFLDTEAFMDEGKAANRSGWPDLASLKVRLDAHLDQLARTASPSRVNTARADILAQCRAAASQPPGTFTLSVPTGGGKTLAGMAFALDHALRHGQRRVIHVIPYTSIIEQTADVFRKVFGDAVIEHHSNAETDEKGGKESARSRLACENWDAPIIVTTTVQFFESLFAARTSRCRKLHNIVGSVVVLDEAQLLPPPFLQPIMDVLNLLSRHYGVTVLLSTATQPALTSREWFGGRINGLDDSREIIADPDRLYTELDRVDVHLPDDLTTPTSWDALAERASTEGDVLIVVGRRRDARELHARMPEGSRHLSALMCGAHRSLVIAEIRAALQARRTNPDLPPVRVVSTQLIEAGVDLDFPVVYRALAGLDSIAQAAGRCNREGLLERGQVHVFVPPEPAPAGLLRMAEQATIGVLDGWSGKPLDRSLFRPYFERLYRSADLDAKDIAGLLKIDRESFGCVGLRRAADAFKLIDNEETGYRSVYVPYRHPDKPKAFEALIGSLRKDGPARWLLRKLQRYAVSLPGYQFRALLDRRDIEEITPGLFVLRSEAQYDAVLGLLIDQPLSAGGLTC